MYCPSFLYIYIYIIYIYYVVFWLLNELGNVPSFHFWNQVTWKTLIEGNELLWHVAALKRTIFDIGANVTCLKTERRVSFTFAKNFNIHNAFICQLTGIQKCGSSIRLYNNVKIMLYLFNVTSSNVKLKENVKINSGTFIIDFL